MIRVKNNGTETIGIGDGKTAEVFEGEILPFFIEGGKVGYQIKFKERNLEWTPPIEIDAVEEQPATNEIEYVPGRPAYLQECGVPEFHIHGWYNKGEFECEHSDPEVYLKCHQHAVTVSMGQDWEIVGL